MKHRRRSILPILLILLLVGYGLWRVSYHAPLSNNKISGNGAIEATEVDVSAKVAGKVQKLLVEEGDDVKTGQLIATLDSGELAGQMEQAQGNLKASDAVYADLADGTRPEDIRRVRAQYASAVAALQQAEARRDLIRAGTRPEKIAQLQQAYKQAQAQAALVKEGPRKEVIEQLKSALAQAKVTLAEAERELNRFEGLLQKGAVASNIVDQQRTKRDFAQTAVDAAQQHLSEAQSGSRPQEITSAVTAAEAARQRLIEAQNGARPQERQEADAAVAQSKMQVTAARAALDLAISGPTKEALAAAKARVDQARGALNTANASHQQTIIYAPINGRVTLRNVELGELVTAGLPIVRLAKLDKVWIRVYVPEEQIGRIKIGQSAQVKTDAYTNHRYKGKVILIAQEPEFTPKNVQTKEERVKLMYGIKIEVNNPHYELKPGMPGDAVINVQ